VSHGDADVGPAEGPEVLDVGLRGNRVERGVTAGVVGRLALVIDEEAGAGERIAAGRCARQAERVAGDAGERRVVVDDREHRLGRVGQADLAGVGGRAEQRQLNGLGQPVDAVVDDWDGERRRRLARSEVDHRLDGRVVVRGDCRDPDRDVADLRRLAGVGALHGDHGLAGVLVHRQRRGLKAEAVGVIRGRVRGRADHQRYGQRRQDERDPTQRCEQAKHASVNSAGACPSLSAASGNYASVPLARPCLHSVSR
jgi:hypothetical protein